MIKVNMIVAVLIGIFGVNCLSASSQSEAIDRIAASRAVLAGCKTQAQIACLIDYKEFCKEHGGINVWYKTCLEESNLHNVADKKIVMKVLEN